MDYISKKVSSVARVLSGREHIVGITDTKAIKPKAPRQTIMANPMAEGNSIAGKFPSRPSFVLSLIHI